jgi:2'-5' RNA ligase
VTRLPVPLARAHLLSVMARVVAAVSAQSPDPAAPDHFISVPDGLMVAFYPPPPLARQLALPGGEPPEDLHITLALPGKLSSLSPEQRRRLPQIMRGFGLISRPLTGTFSGVTEFPARDGVKPVVLLVDVPGLPAWRQRLVEVLALNGYTVASDHGFVPHLTLKYAKEGETVAVDVPALPLVFDRVCLVMGERKKEYPLGGNPDVEEPMDVFAAGARRSAARKERKEVAAVNRYQATLESDYREWADDLAGALANDPDNADEIIAAALLALLLLLRRRGAEHLPDAVALALERAGGTASAAILQRLADAIARNDGYLTESLLPALGERLRELLASGEWALAAGDGADAVRALVGTWLEALTARVGLYAGAWWTLAQEAAGLALSEQGQAIRWVRDEQARHCETCLRYGEQTYASWDEMLALTGGAYPGYETDCGSNCRCEILAADDLPA